MRAQIRGIDVSHYQDSIDWLQVANSGMAFCFIKATEGADFADPFFQQNWIASADAGLWRGAYHYGLPGSDAKAQAQYFFGTVGSLGVQSLPPVLDLETLDGQSPQDALDWTIVFLATADELFGRQTLLYTDAGFWQTLQSLPGAEGLAVRPLWLAAYSAAPTVPPPWINWTFWQYSDGTNNGGTPVPGIVGDVDQNWFAGNATQLAALR